MHIRSALFTVIIPVVQLIFRVKAHTQAVLPDLARLALNHKFTSIRVVLSFHILLQSSDNPVEKNTPVLPQIQRVIPCSSSSSAAGPSVVTISAASNAGCGGSNSSSFSFGLRLDLVDPWVEFDELADADCPVAFRSSTESSGGSSLFRPLLLPLLLEESKGGREASLNRGPISDSGEWEFDKGGPERRPELRLVSLGDKGGPITCAIENV